MTTATGAMATTSYLTRVRSEFAFLKSASTPQQAAARSLRMPGGAGSLVAVSEAHADSPEIIGLLSRWREGNSWAFATQFPVTEARTAAWLRSSILDVPDRLLFLVTDEEATPIGHVGFVNGFNESRELELDNVLRGVKKGRPGLMSDAVGVLLDWARERLEPQRIVLRVLSDNLRAVAFYRRLGFVDDELQALRKHEDGDQVSFRYPEKDDVAPADKFYLRMIHEPHRGKVTRARI